MPPVTGRVRKRRAQMRAAGLRPVQMWVPDTRKPGFSEQCHRQAHIVARSDLHDRALRDFMDAALTDLKDTGDP